VEGLKSPWKWWKSVIPMSWGVSMTISAGTPMGLRFSAQAPSLALLASIT